MKDKFIISSDIMFRKAGDIYIAYNQKEASMFEFNETGGFIYELISSGKSYAEILHIICEDYQVSTEDIKDDVDNIIERLKDLKVIYSKT